MSKYCATSAYDVYVKYKPAHLGIENPAKLIRKRFSDDIINQLLEIKWWDWDYDKITRNVSAIVGADIKKLKGAK